jgi:hypothetical protein
VLHKYGVLYDRGTFCSPSHGIVPATGAFDLIVTLTCRELLTHLVAQSLPPANSSSGRHLKWRSKSMLLKESSNASQMAIQVNANTIDKGVDS